MALSKWTGRITGWLVVLALILVSAILLLRQRSRADIAQGQTHGSITVESSSFASGDPIPRRFTCDGGSQSPEIHWPAPQTGTKSLAVVMEDLDAPFGFVHWLVYNIPAEARGLAEGASSQAALPHGAVQGINSLDTLAYFGPCPPGAKPHHYAFRLYALDVPLDLPPGRTKQQLAEAVKEHVLAEGQITGSYVRGSQ